MKESLKIGMIKSKMYNPSNAWATKGKDGKIYYSCEEFFGIQDKKGNQIISGHVLEDETIYDNWYEIAQQLYAMKEGWA